MYAPGLEARQGGCRFLKPCQLRFRAIGGKPLSQTHLEGGGGSTQRTLRPEESLKHDGAWGNWSWIEAKSESQSFWPRTENPNRD